MKKFDEFINENLNDVESLLKSIYTDFFNDVSDEIGHEDFWKEIAVREIPPQNNNEKSYDVYITIKYPTIVTGTREFRDAEDNLEVMNDRSKRLETIISYKENLGFTKAYFKLDNRDGNNYEEYVLTGSADGHIFNSKSLDFIESKIGKEKLDLLKSISGIKKYNL